MAKQYYEIGAIHRGSFRRVCLQLDLNFKEERSFFESCFMVKGNVNNLLILENQVKEWAK